MKRRFALVSTFMMVAGFAAPLAGQTASSLVVHARLSPNGTPLADAEVILDEGKFLGVTDAQGVLRVSGLTPGVHRVRVRFIGLATGDRTVRLAPGVATDESFELAASPIELDSLSVVAYRGTMAAAMRGFNQRKDRGIGYFITQEDIDKVRPHAFSDLLRLVPGMRFDCASFSGHCSAGMRSAPPSGVLTVREGGLEGPLSAESCPIQYYVDGHYEPHANVNDFDPKDIAAVEVYVHGAQAPARFSLRKNARCGVVLVWLRQSLGG